MDRRLLLGAAIVVAVIAPAVYLFPHSTHIAASGASQSVVHPRFADLRGEQASAEVRKMADWVVHSGDHGKRAFAILDKKNAKVFVFDRQGRLKAASAALLGSAVGDDSAPGIGDKPLAQVLPEEKTTPAGRFIAEMGESSTRGEDVVWVDYDAAVSMHRVVNPKGEHRLERLASSTTEDNRISFGCINLPPQFYEGVLRPTVQSEGAVIYVLPEVRALRQVFASFYDVESAGAKVASDSGTWHALTTRVAHLP